MEKRAGSCREIAEMVEKRKVPETGEFPSAGPPASPIEGPDAGGIARELDVTVGTLNGWENGRHRPIRAQRKRLLRMAQATGIAPPLLPTARPEQGQ
jgi:hypothetical protein